ncbi:MAG: hypothetical protein KJ666_09785 [Bacteroidetes bacterium]|nr:hypothetical protein [Bacteroidota bacterium]
MSGTRKPRLNYTVLARLPLQAQPGGQVGINGIFDLPREGVNFKSLSCKRELVPTCREI